MEVARELGSPHGVQEEVVALALVDGREVDEVAPLGRVGRADLRRVDHRHVQARALVEHFLGVDQIALGVGVAPTPLRQHDVDAEAAPVEHVEEAHARPGRG